MTLALDDDDLAACVQCGLCLPHCPTFRATGEESSSPRGRIALMRQVQWAGAPVDDAFVSYMDACVQCRGCETACPAGVPFGRLMERTRQELARTRPSYQPWWRRLGYRALAYHSLVLAGSSLLALAQRLHLLSRARAVRLGLPPRLPLRRGRLTTDTQHGSQHMYLFTGCVMDAWQRDVHAAVVRVTGAAGAAVRFPVRTRGAGCCGALAGHAGLVDDARRMAQAVMRSMPGDAAILVDSAGCGAALKDYGHLLGTPEATAFASRVLDVHEWLAANLDRLPPARRPAAAGAVIAVQDPCHLRHVQHAHEQVRTALRPYVAALAELDDDGLCCGAGGAYAALHPDLAGQIRQRKLAAIARSGARVVASANPGCLVHLANAGLDVRHPVALIDEALHG